MTWSYGGVRIFVQDRTLDWDQIIARLNPIGGGTVKQFFGWDERIVKVNAYVVGNDDLNILASFTTSGTSFPLISPYGSVDYDLKHISAKQVRSNCQTLRTDLAEDSPMYIVDMELYLDESD